MLMPLARRRDHEDPRARPEPRPQPPRAAPLAAEAQQAAVNQEAARRQLQRLVGKRCLRGKTVLLT
jgi:hypothetical protein